MDEVKGSDQELLEGIERGIWLGVVLAYRCMGGVR
jgi:hypothetical protein